MAENREATKVVTSADVRFSYLHAFEPREGLDGGQPKYSVSLVISKDDTETLNAIDKAVKAAYAAGKDSKLKGKTMKAIKLPLRDGDEERPDDPVYANAMFVNANNTNQPGIVDKFLRPIINPDDIKSGDYGRAAISFYAYNNKSQGIACSLNNLMKVTDGEPLSSRTKAADDFAEFKAEFDGADEVEDDSLS